MGLLASALFSGWTGDALAAEPPVGTAVAAPESAEVSPKGPGLTALELRDLGLENIAVETDPSPPHYAYENRRYRHSVEVLGLIARRSGRPFLAFERRLGLVAAAVATEGPIERPRFVVRYPSDADFPRPPGGRLLAPTSRSIDLEVGPLLSYELGRPYQPVQFRFQLEPRIRYNPWPGSRATASVVLPIYDDFQTSVLHPDVDQVRPGLVTLEQFAWIPRVALCSATVGLFGDNRYGLSVGASRPLLEGRLLFDAQADLTGFLAFPRQGTLYSSMADWSSFAGVTWRPPVLDLAVRFRVAQFLYGDQGEELEIRRSVGDVDIALFGLRSTENNLKGVRVTLPVPPMTRPTQHKVRVLPVERFPFSYRTDTESIGLYVTGVASREDFLRQLSAPSLSANQSRFLRAAGKQPPRSGPDPVDWVSFTGTTGFINTPWAGGIKDRGIELGYAHIPKRWSYDGRGRYANEPWTLALGLIPRIEVALRFTRIPGLRGGVTDPSSQITTDTDHMACVRLTLLTAKPKRPGLAVGVDDVEGTRRYHSSYLVAGVPFAILRVQNRFSLGYAPHVFTAARHVLDGGFGAFEVSPWRVVAARVEYDTEKWNAGVGVALTHGLRLRAAMLGLETASVGVGWFHEL